MPVGLIILTVLAYKRSNARILFRRNFAEDIVMYWQQWSLRLGGIAQIVLLSIVPLVAIYEMYQHLTKGPRDILEVRQKGRPLSHFINLKKRVSPQS